VTTPLPSTAMGGSLLLACIGAFGVIRRRSLHIA
jgi:hypothetical protein